MGDISVVICTKNEEATIERCLVGLSEQEVTPEIIVVDGHSRDGTVEIARGYADRILLDSGGGLSEARNIGWRAAQSSIIAFCDADCWPIATWTKNVIELMKPGVVGASGPLISYDGNSTTKMNITIWANWFPRLLTLFGYSCIWGANMAFRRDVLERYPFRLRFLEDYDIGYRLRRSKSGTLCFDSRIPMPISSRRFEHSFYRTCLRFYVKPFLMMRVFKIFDSTGYFDH